MDYKDLTTLIVKVFGAFLVVHVLTLVPTYTVDSIMAFDGWFTILHRTVLPLFFPLLAGLVMLFLPATLTNRLVRGEKLSDLPEYLPQLERIALATLGFFLLFSSLSDLGYYLSGLIGLREPAASSSRGFPATAPVDAYGGIVGTSIGLLISIWFILGSRGILAVVNKLRSR